MKNKQKIHKDYLQYCTSRPTLFGKDQHWNAYFEGYEMGYQDASEESLNSFIKEMGMDLKDFPTDIDKQFEVMRDALLSYYANK